MSSSNYIIKSLVIKPELKSVADAEAVHVRLSEIANQVIIPLIESIFDQFDHRDKMFLIDRIELDIGQIPLDDLENTIRKQIMIQLSRAIGGLKSEHDPASEFPFVVIDGQPKEHQLETGDETSKVLDQKHTSLDALIYFIEHGSLPWWITGVRMSFFTEGPPSGIVDRVSADLSENAPQITAEIVLKYLKNENLFGRIVLQLPPAFLYAAVEQLLKDSAVQAPNASEIENLLDTINHMDISKAAAPTQVRVRFWRAVVTALANKDSVPRSKSRLFAEIINNYCSACDLDLETACSSLEAYAPELAEELTEEAAEEDIFLCGSPDDEIEPELIKTKRKNIKKEQRIYNEDYFETTPRDQVDIKKETSQKRIQETPTIRTAAMINAEKEPDTHNDREDALEEGLQRATSLLGSTYNESEEIFITNAGVVVLWPFVESFFEAIGLVRDSAFIDEEARARAVLVMQYLVDGSTKIPEFVLPLNKVLCGMDLRETLGDTLEINDSDREECNKLLNSVISHWSALKTISRDGFQQTFLQRNGMLSPCAGGWIVRVERKTFDILLDRIPWTIGIIKMPWLERILFVEW